MDGWREVQSTVLDRSLTAVQPLGHNIHKRVKILIRIQLSSTGDGDSVFLPIACTHLQLTRLHDVIRHIKILRRVCSKVVGPVCCAVRYRGAERHMYCDSNLSGWCKTRHVAYDAVWSGNVYRPDCVTSVYDHYHHRKKPHTLR